MTGIKFGYVCVSSNSVTARRGVYIYGILLDFHKNRKVQGRNIIPYVSLCVCTRVVHRCGNISHPQSCTLSASYNATYIGAGLYV